MGWSSSAKVPHGSCVNVLQKKPKAPAPPPPPIPPSFPEPGSFRLRETSSRIFANGQDHNGNEFSRWTSLRFWPHPVPPSLMIYGFINATYNASPTAGREALRLTVLFLLLWSEYKTITLDCRPFWRANNGNFCVLSLLDDFFLLVISERSFFRELIKCGDNRIILRIYVIYVSALLFDLAVWERGTFPDLVER